jgi:DNA-binding transcriptional LysR family regulator
LVLRAKICPAYFDHLSAIFASLKQKPRVIEEHDSMSGIVSSVEAGTGVALAKEVFSYSFGNRVKLLHLRPEPKPLSIGIVAPKRKLSSAAGKFCQCAKEAVSPRQLRETRPTSEHSGIRSREPGSK